MIHLLHPGIKRVDCRRCTGFTLIEMVIGLSVIGMCAALTIGPIVSLFEVLVMTSESRDICDEATVAVERMTSEIKEAEAISLTGQTQIEVTKAHPATDGYSEVVFYLDGSTLYRRGEPGGSPAILARDVDTFQITYNAGGQNLVSLQLELTGSGGEQFQIGADVYPMNLDGVSSRSFYNDDESAGDWELVIDNG